MNDSRSEPEDKGLYEKAKQIVKNRVKVWPSAYASGQLVKEYKRMGGKYKKGKSKESSLSRWYKEDWRNVCEKNKNGGYKKCGRSSASTNYMKYPYCRPSRRISRDTPKTIRELSPKKLKNMCVKKRSSMKKSHGKQTRIRLQSRKRLRGGSGKIRGGKIRGGSAGEKDLNGVRFTRGPGRYKYTAILPNGKRVHFGHRDYQHYKDSVPKSLGGKLWTKLDHNDNKRRENYRKRHGGVLTKDRSKAYLRKYSPSWFSYYFLW